MLYLSIKNQFVEQEILNNLRSSGNIRIKGEEKIFKKFMYFIQLGIKKYNLSEENSFDAYSDTILAAIDSITNGSFQGRSSLKTFLFHIFYNKCVDILRRKSTQKNSVHKIVGISDLQMSLSDNAHSIIEKLIERADVESFKQQLKKLSDKSQRLLLLTADGYTDKEIALELKFKTHDVVKTSRLRCIRAMRQLNEAC